MKATSVTNPLVAETERLVVRCGLEWRNDMLTPMGHQFDLAKRGYHAVYRDNEVNHCPGCGRTHWYVGRTLAECGFCATALPLSESFRQASAARVIGRSGPFLSSAFAA